MDTTLLGLLALSVFGALCIFFGVRKPRPVKQHDSQRTKQKISAMIDHAEEVVTAYGAVLEQTSQAGQPGISFYSESQLPHTKSEIRKCIELLLLAPLNETQLGHLAVADISLNDFIPEEEYEAINEQQVGFSKALQLGRAGDVDTMAALMVNSGTPASRLLTKQIQERFNRENMATLKRHQTLKLAAAKLGTSTS
jgi:hypothetical protein